MSALELHSNLYPTVRGPLGPPGELFTATDTGSKSWSRTQTRAWGKVKLHLPSGLPQLQAESQAREKRVF